MRCQHCGGFMSQKTQQLMDSIDQLTIRTWRCRKCGAVTEEIRRRPAHDSGETRRIQYAVRVASATRASATD